MTAAEAVRQVKGLQRAFLLELESHPLFEEATAEQFNELRRRVFRSTFRLYRFGIVGLPREGALSGEFFGWLTPEMMSLANANATWRDVLERCFRVSLEAFRIGARIEREE